jgi:hypothetical protein
LNTLRLPNRLLARCGTGPVPQPLRRRVAEHFALEPRIGLDARQFFRRRVDEARRDAQRAGRELFVVDDDLARGAGGAVPAAGLDHQLVAPGLLLQIDPDERLPAARAGRRRGHAPAERAHVHPVEFALGRGRDDDQLARLQ